MLDKADASDSWDTDVDLTARIGAAISTPERWGVEVNLRGLGKGPALSLGLQ